MHVEGNTTEKNDTQTDIILAGWGSSGLASTNTRAAQCKERTHLRDVRGAQGSDNRDMARGCAQSRLPEQLQRIRRGANSLPDQAPAATLRGGGPQPRFSFQTWRAEVEAAWRMERRMLSTTPCFWQMAADSG